jgi:hypothetical protein
VCSNGNAACKYRNHQSTHTFRREFGPSFSSIFLQIHSQTLQHNSGGCSSEKKSSHFQSRRKTVSFIHMIKIAIIHNHRFTSHIWHVILSVHVSKELIACRIAAVLMSAAIPIHYFPGKRSESTKRIESANCQRPDNHTASFPCNLGKFGACLRLFLSS